jgi:hypothetical protein
MFLPSHFNTSGGCSLEDSHLSSSYSLLGIFPLDFLDFLPFFFYRLLSSKANVLFDVTPMLQRRRETGGTDNSAGLGTNGHTTADLIH